MIVRVPGDKSISQRALILASLADGESRLRGVLPAADPRSTAGALRALGAAIAPLPENVPELMLASLIAGHRLGLCPGPGEHALVADAEFALVDAPVLARLRPDPGPFRDRFRGDDVVTFRNLGGDAFLIAPSPGDAGTDYAHLAAFLRTAPDAARRALWRCVGRSVLRSLTAVPLWVSTSGAGVAWLHVRLDARPKYYQHRPYRQAGA